MACTCEHTNEKQHKADESREERGHHEEKKLEEQGRSPRCLAEIVFFPFLSIFCFHP